MNMTGATIMPSSVYPANMLTPRWEMLYGRMFALKNYKRINRYAAATPEIKDEFEKWISNFTNLMSYKLPPEYVDPAVYPKWEYSEMNTFNGANAQLVSDIKELNNMSAKEVDASTVLPDASLIINSISMEKGISAHFQTNNILFNKYHRANGDSLAYMSLGPPSPEDEAKGRPPKKHGVLFPTEAAVGKINLITNMHLQ